MKLQKIFVNFYKNKIESVKMKTNCHLHCKIDTMVKNIEKTLNTSDYYNQNAFKTLLFVQKLSQKMHRAHVR